MIGRQREMTQMRDAFDRAVDGHAQVVRVLGEAGVGKTRLVEEFVAQLDRDGRLDGVAMRCATCSALGDQTFGVLASLIRDGYGIGPDESLDAARDKLTAGLEAIGASGEETAEMVPYLKYVLGLGGEDETFAQLEPEQLKRQIFMAARSMFEHRLQVAPILMVVEDLHWADAASVELLRFLVDRLDDRRFMLLLTHRPNFDASALATSRTSQTAIRLAALSAASQGMTGGNTPGDRQAGLARPIEIVEKHRIPIDRRVIVRRHVMIGNHIFSQDAAHSLIQRHTLDIHHRGHQGVDHGQRFIDGHHLTAGGEAIVCKLWHSSGEPHVSDDKIGNGGQVATIDHRLLLTIERPVADYRHDGRIVPAEGRRIGIDAMHFDKRIVITGHAFADHQVDYGHLRQGPMLLYPATMYQGPALGRSYHDLFRAGVTVAKAVFSRLIYGRLVVHAHHGRYRQAASRKLSHQIHHEAAFITARLPGNADHPACHGSGGSWRCFHTARR